MKNPVKVLLMVAMATLLIPPLPLSAQSADPFAMLDEEVEAFDKDELGPDYDDPEYLKYKEEILAEFAAYKKIVLEERGKFTRKVEKKWEKPELSTNKVWVEYSPDLEERRSVDFEKETITIEQPATGNPEKDKAKLKASLTELVKKDKAAAFEGDSISKAVEERSEKEIALLETAPLTHDPILIQYLLGAGSATDQEIDEIVNHMMEEMQVTTTIQKGVEVQKVEVKLAAPERVVKAAERRTARTRSFEVPDKLSGKAGALWPHVDSSADKSKIEPALVYAIIETESAFNPMAKSHVPAYGLMQIVPKSAGLDATEQIFGRGKSRVLSPSYLYDSEKNIEVGATYLNILYFRYLRAIKDPTSRLYCTIAAYNTGAGNVARAFTGGTKISAAAIKINELTPQQVYDHLLENLPHDETKHYLERVSKRRDKYGARLGT